MAHARRDCSAAAIGLTNLALASALPRRLYPSVRAALLVIAFAALACALRRAAERGAAVARAPAGRSDGDRAGAAARPAARSRRSTPTRASSRTAQAPATAFVLDALAWVKPFAAGSARAGAATPPTPAVPRRHASAALARFAHADSLADAHLVLVTVDALRADRLRADRMPTLAALAARGVTFTHAYAAAPSTAVSLTSLMTARHPSHLDDRPLTLVERLRAAGWNTADFYPAGLFFDGGGALRPYADAHFGVAWADTRTLAADGLTDAVLARVRVAVGPRRAAVVSLAALLRSARALRAARAAADAPAVDRYDAEVRAVDRALARLVDGLTAFARPTLLVVTGDHGEEFGEHGGAYHGSSLYDEQLRVPLVVALLGGDLVAERVDAPVSLVELAPTLTRLLEAPVFTDAQPLGATDVHAAVDSHRMLVRGSWKLIHDSRRDVDELYDLSSDPGEQHNLADARAEVAAAAAGGARAMVQPIERHPACRLRHRPSAAGGDARHGRT